MPKNRPPQICHPDKKYGANGLCVNCYAKIKYRKRTPLTPEQKIIRAKRFRELYLLRKYNITPEEYDRLFQLQNGLCAICHKPEADELVIDHNHTTGKIRGLLCHQCNLGLGKFHDNLTLIRSALSYLLDTL